VSLNLKHQKFLTLNIGAGAGQITSDALGSNGADDLFVGSPKLQNMTRMFYLSGSVCAVPIKGFAPLTVKPDSTGATVSGSRSISHCLNVSLNTALGATSGTASVEFDATFSNETALSLVSHPRYRTIGSSIRLEFSMPKSIVGELVIAPLMAGWTALDRSVIWSMMQKGVPEYCIRIPLRAGPQAYNLIPPILNRIELGRWLDWSGSANSSSASNAAALDPDIDPFGGFLLTFAGIDWDTEDPAPRMRMSVATIGQVELPLGSATFATTPEAMIPVSAAEEAYSSVQRAESESLSQSLLRTAGETTIRTAIPLAMSEAADQARRFYYANRGRREELRV
jgi:hypothetical protein